MWRCLRLFIDFSLSALVFTFFVSGLVLLLNPEVLVTPGDSFLLFTYLLLYYGIGWWLVTAILYFFVQFAAGRKFAVGIIWPPTLTYLLSFTTLVITAIYFLNYDYYRSFLSAEAGSLWLRILIGQLVLVITGMVFLLQKGRSKRWVQAAFLAFLSYQLLTTFTGMMSMSIPQIPAVKQQQLVQEVTPRRIRLVIADGISMSHLLSQSSEQKLLNFNFLIQNGVRARIHSFKPNFSHSQINTVLSGLPPSAFHNHSQVKFKVGELEQEFDLFPRYLFFRYSSVIGVTAFYRRFAVPIKDHIREYYAANNFGTSSLIYPDFTPMYSERSLEYNRRFKPLYADLLNQMNRRYELVKRFFFFDDYLKRRIPDLKDTPLYYSSSRLFGLANVARYFSQYSTHRMFETVPEADIKRYSWILEKYYEYYDSIVGNLISTTGEDELLVIISLYEFEPLPVWRRVLLNMFGKRDVYVYKPLDARGTIFLYEKNALKKGYPVNSISIYDIFPTLLYYSGFQLSRDLRGEVVREIFTDEFQLNNPIDIRPDNP
ncbi:MAG: hypothetical protein JXA62_06140 [Candidatus Aminicenantes bacterium]|nr:hypothetical protein [Candidatus Aminicenantes bacterium]